MDRDGNKSKKGVAGGVLNGALSSISNNVVEISYTRSGNASIIETRYKNGRKTTDVTIDKGGDVIKWESGKSKPTYYYGPNALSNALASIGKSPTRNTKGGGYVKAKPTYKKVNPTMKCPEKDKTAAANSVLDALQTALDWIGWIPGIGDVCDGINAAISFLRGDLINALISVACMVFSTFADTLLKPLKNSKQIARVVDAIKDAFGVGVLKLAEKIGEYATKLTKIPVIGKLLNKISSAFDSFKTWIKKLFKGASGAGKNIIDKAKINGKRIGDMNKQEIINNVPDGWKIHDNNGFVHIKDEKGITRIRIDPADNITPIDHIHIYDELENPLSIDGIIKDRKSPEVHIPLKK